ncbi:MCE family protein [Conexibacter sp. W3-3-2]|uniref:MlaD family protein n=1 Tax=Conexibacter sp. W3-3-2 TaxID=2675227 RepID=UPI0012BA02DD|nr:MlaD family protein [Conexibacter sp. W3-3-2]MTD46855.1 MCE family protein [Conexibacter sp. W3-3-2]
MTAARAGIVGLLVVTLAVVAVVLTRGDDVTSYTLRFENAGQLVKDDDVQIGGRRVGSIREITLTGDNQAEVRIELENAYAPLHVGSTAVIRATSLSGIANRYIAISPGANSNPEIPEGTTLSAESSTTIVDLDQLFNTLDPKARRSLQEVIRGSSVQYNGKGRQANEGAKYFNPAISTTARLVNELTRDQKVFTDFLVSSSKVVTALAERRPQLASLIANTNQTAAAIGDERVALDTSLGVLPDTLRRANTTFVNLRSTITDLDTLVAESKPATKELARFLRELRPLVADARPTIKDLRTLIRKPGTGNDLIELVRKAPRLERVARPALANGIEAFRKTTPVLQFIRPYTADLAGWIRDFGQGASNYDANGHYARISPIANLYSLTDNVLNPLQSAAPLDGFQNGVVRRCPGAASQTRPDGSNNWRDTDGKLDCDPSLTLPGP